MHSSLDCMNKREKYDSVSKILGFFATVLTPQPFYCVPVCFREDLSKERSVMR